MNYNPIALWRKHKQEIQTLKKQLDATLDFFEDRDPSHSELPGTNIKFVRRSGPLLFYLYRHYFRVRLFGQKNVKDTQYMIVSNHTGQIPIDGVLICNALLTEFHPPRLARPLIERILVKIPLVSTFLAQYGCVLGNRENCLELLQRGESVLVFPEGVRGSAKKRSQFYQTAPFSRGFYRMALKAGVEILPVAVVGAEEMFPFVYHNKTIAKMARMPALPLSPNMFPLPSPIDIYFGEPIILPQNLAATDPNEKLDPYIRCIEQQIQSMVDEGLEKRRPFFFNTQRGSSGDNHAQEMDS